MIENDCMEKLKTCNYCKKEVSADAIKCPYCREWLNKTSLSFKNPYVAAIILIIIGLSMPYLYKFIIVKKYDEMFQNPIPYSTSSKLKITQSNLVKDKLGYRVIGEIENLDSFMWERVELLTIFKNKKGDVIFLSPTYIHDFKSGDKRLFQSAAPCSEMPLDLDNVGNYELIIESASARPWKK